MSTGQSPNLEPTSTLAQGPLSLVFDLVRVGSEHTQLGPLLQASLSLVGPAMDAELAVVFLMEGNILRHSVHLERPFESPGLLETFVNTSIDDATLGGLAARERKTVRTSLDTWPSRSREGVRRFGGRYGIATPMFAKGEIIGVISLVRKMDRPFSDAEVELLEVCSKSIGLAMEHVRLIDAERQRVETFRGLLRVGNAVTSNLDLTHVLDQAAQELPPLVDATDCGILLVNPQTGLLEGRATSATEIRARFLALRISPQESRSATAEAARTGSIVVMDDTSKTPIHPAAVDMFSPRSLVALPLMLQGRAIGVALVGDRHRARHWTEDEMERLRVMAGPLAVAVANAHLFEDLKRSYRALEQTQGELVRKERLAALGELAAVIAHEVRNPLGVIYNAMAGLRRFVPSSSEGDALLGMAREEAERLNMMVGDLLDFARPRLPELRPHTVSSLVHGALASTAPACTQQGVRVEVDLTRAPERVPVDEPMMRQALVNLILNGVQAMPKGGVLTLTAVQCEHQGRPVWELDVSDTGLGISPEVAEKMFQPFFSTRARGSGLGLAVVKRVAEAHQGEVQLRPRPGPGPGATLTLRLPLEA